MPMEGCMPQGLLIKKIFDAIKEMVTDVNLDCNDAGISLQAMDTSHVALVMLTLKTGAFDHYQCTRSRPLGLNMGHVSKIFKLCGNDDQVIIRHEDEDDKIQFIFECTSEDKVSEFQCRLMNFEQDHLGVPETEFAATVTMPSKVFAKTIADLQQFSDTLVIDVTPKGVKFTARNDIGTGSTLLKSKSGGGGGDGVEVVCEESKVQLTFASRYLGYFAKASNLADTIRLRMSAQQPLEVLYTLSDDPQIGQMKFYLAPKMDDTGMMG